MEKHKTPQQKDNNEEWVFELIGEIAQTPFILNEEVAKLVHKLLPRPAWGVPLHFATTLIVPYILAVEFLPHNHWGEWVYDTFLDKGIPAASAILTAHAWWKVYRHPKEEWNPHGNARFATDTEVKRSALMKTTEGIVFGKIGRRLVVKPATEDGHAAIVAGSGLGKTKSVANPTLLRWPGSALVINIKGDISAATMEIRGAKQKVFDFNPEDPDHSSRYNPIDWIKDEMDAQEMARIIIPPQTGDNAYFSNTAQDILAAALLEGSYKKQTISEICRRVRTTPFADLIGELMESPFPGVADLAASGFEVPEKTLGNVIGELRRNVTLFATSKGIRKVCSSSDWTPETLEEGATIYLTVPEEKFTTYAKLFGLIFNQVIKHLTGRGEGKQPPVLLVMDEFAQLGKLTDFENRISTLRSRNVHCMIFLQDLSQVEKLYGVYGRRTIMSNCRYKLVLGIDDPDTGKYFTTFAGTRPAENKSKSIRNGEETENISEIGVPLVRVEEWRNLEKPILFPYALHPVKVDQVWVTETHWDPIMKRLLEKELRQLEKEVEKQSAEIVPFPDRKELPKAEGGDRQ